MLQRLAARYRTFQEPREPKTATEEFVAVPKQLPGIPIKTKAGSFDGIPQAVKPEYLDQSTANKFRTPPLWGLRYRHGLMHDGNSPGIDQAIGRHRGEATAVRQQYEHLTAAEKKQLQEFLNSL